MEKIRDYRLDNIKVLMIFLVVFGHLLELYAPESAIYHVIYTFHMPVFLFTAGYFAKFSPRKILCNLIYPYVLFQILYSLFQAYVINQNPDTFTLQFTTPYWLLWYLFTLAIYYMLTPMMKGRYPWAVLLVSVALALAAGFDNSIGYFLSLSRTLVFMPFFVLGFIWRRSALERIAQLLPVKIIAFVGVIIATVWVANSKIISSPMLYGSYPYAGVSGFSVGIRAILLLVALGWIITLMWMIPRLRVPLVSVLGQNTLGIFLCHGFIQIFLRYHNPFIYDMLPNLALTAMLSLGIVVFFGNKYIGWLMRWICTGQWLLVLLEKYEQHRAVSAETR